MRRQLFGCSNAAVQVCAQSTRYRTVCMSCVLMVPDCVRVMCADGTACHVCTRYPMSCVHTVPYAINAHGTGHYACHVCTLYRMPCVHMVPQFASGVFSKIGAGCPPPTRRVLRPSPTTYPPPQKKSLPAGAQGAQPITHHLPPPPQKKNLPAGCSAHHPAPGARGPGRV